jgi:hypothetical protein
VVSGLSLFLVHRGGDGCRSCSAKAFDNCLAVAAGYIDMDGPNMSPGGRYPVPPRTKKGRKGRLVIFVIIQLLLLEIRSIFSDNSNLVMVVEN